MFVPIAVDAVPSNLGQMHQYRPVLSSPYSDIPTHAAGTTVVPVEGFLINVDEAVLTDLRNRIRSSRLPGPAPGEPWSQGTDGAYLRGFLTDWADGFDWRTSERELNRIPQFRTRLDDVQIHFVHARAAAERGHPAHLDERLAEHLRRAAPAGAAAHRPGGARHRGAGVRPGNPLVARLRLLGTSGSHRRHLPLHSSVSGIA